MKKNQPLLRRFLDENGIQHKWFAKQLGISYSQFSQILNGHRKLNPKYWKKVVELTDRKISLEDLLEDCTEEK